MKLGRIVGVIVAFFVFHLIFFVTGSTIQRSLSDDIRNGISVAGKILGTGFQIRNKVIKPVV